MRYNLSKKGLNIFVLSFRLTLNVLKIFTLLHVVSSKLNLLNTTLIYIRSLNPRIDRTSFTSSLIPQRKPTEKIQRSPEIQVFCSVRCFPCSRCIFVVDLTNKKLCLKAMDNSSSYSKKCTRLLIFSDQRIPLCGKNSLSPESFCILFYSFVFINILLCYLP